MLKKAIIAAALLAVTAPAFAAEDGPPGSTSTGSININVTVLPEPQPTVQISGLTDLSFLGLNGTVNVQGFVACIFHTSPSFSLELRQVGRTGPLGAFSQTTGDLVPLLVEIGNLQQNATIAPTVFTQAALVPGLSTLSNDAVCSDGNRQPVLVTATFGQQQPGIYQATLQFILAVE